MFRIHEGLEITGKRAWGPNTGGSKKGREQDINLIGTYATSWQPYSEIGNKRGEFRSLTFYVQPTSLDIVRKSHHIRVNLGSGPLS